MNTLFYAVHANDPRYFDISDSNITQSIRTSQIFYLIQRYAKWIDKINGAYRYLLKQHVRTLSIVAQHEANIAASDEIRVLFNDFADFLKRSGGCFLVENGVIPRYHG